MKKIGTKTIILLAFLLTFSVILSPFRNISRVYAATHEGGTEGTVEDVKSGDTIVITDDSDETPGGETPGTEDPAPVDEPTEPAPTEDPTAGDDEKPVDDETPVDETPVDETPEDDTTGEDDKTPTDEETSTDDKTPADDTTGTDDKTPADDTTGTDDKAGTDDKSETDDKAPADDKKSDADEIEDLSNDPVYQAHHADQKGDITKEASGSDSPKTGDMGVIAYLALAVSGIATLAASKKRK